MIDHPRPFKHDPREYQRVVESFREAATEPPRAQISLPSPRKLQGTVEASHCINDLLTGDMFRAFAYVINYDWVQVITD